MPAFNQLKAITLALLPFFRRPRIAPGVGETFRAKLRRHGLACCGFSQNQRFSLAAEGICDTTGVNIREKMRERVLRIGTAADFLGFLPGCRRLRQQGGMAGFVQGADAVLNGCEVLQPFGALVHVQRPIVTGTKASPNKVRKVLAPKYRSSMPPAITKGREMK